MPIHGRCTRAAIISAIPHIRNPDAVGIEVRPSVGLDSLTHACSEIQSMPRFNCRRCSASTNVAMRMSAPPMTVVTRPWRIAAENGVSSAAPARPKASAVLNTIGANPGNIRTSVESCIHQPTITAPPRSTSTAPINLVTTGIPARLLVRDTYATSDRRLFLPLKKNILFTQGLETTLSMSSVVRTLLGSAGISAGEYS